MKNLIPEKETLTVEFKSDKKKISDEVIIDSVVAFANTEGGEFYLGVEDDGTVSGIHPEHEDYTRLAAFIANKTIPPISTIVEEIDAEYPVIKITVPKSRQIVASTVGKIQRRKMKADNTPENIPMYPYEINSRLSELSMLDYSSLPVPDSNYDDLDKNERERLRSILRNYNGEEYLLNLDDEELDKALQLVKQVDGKLVPTFAGMLLIGKENKLREYIPTAEVIIQQLQGSNVIVNKSIHFPILKSLEIVFNFIDARNPEYEMEFGLFRMSIPDYNIRAIREAVVNAFSHRDYTRLGAIRVQMDDDGLSISNPGGFIEGVTLYNLLTVEPHGRNPVLADALKRLGLAERSGRGVDRIFEGSLMYGKPSPDYSDSTAVVVRLFIPRSIPDENFVKMLNEEEKRTNKLPSINSLLILNILKQGRRMTLSDLATETHIIESKLRATVERLLESGLVEATGNGKNREYILSSKVYKNKLDYVRQSNIDSIRYPEMILKLAKEKTYITRNDVIELLHVTSSQAYRLLKTLTDERKLRLLGNGRNASYKLIKD